MRTLWPIGKWFMFHWHSWSLRGTAPQTKIEQIFCSSLEYHHFFVCLLVFFLKSNTSITKQIYEKFESDTNILVGKVVLSYWSKQYFPCFDQLSKFQTSLPLTAWSSLAVSELQLSAGTPLRSFHRSLWSWTEVNCQSGQVIDSLLWSCLMLGLPSATSDACAVVQISSKRQCGKRQASLKAALLKHCLAY